MGIDKSLSDRYPSVIINGSKYHYGREPKYGEYLVEHESIAKDYWVFKEKEDLQAFLINLPESADRNLRLKLHPDWRDVTPEQRDAYFEQDKFLFRAMAAEKLKDGTAQSFNMDLEGEHGPHEPQRIESRSTEPAIERVERQLHDWKIYHSWEGGLTEAGKLRVLEGELDWTGVTARDKEAVLAREVDFAAITPEQFEFVYEDIAFDKTEPADPAVAQAIFDRSRAQPGPRPVRDATRNLIESILLDAWPRNAAVVDFGIDSQKHYEALYYPVRNEEITAEALDAALGKGENLTALARSSPSNPHGDIVFRTSWDELLPPHAADGDEPPTPGEIASDDRPHEPENGNGQGRGGDKSRKR